MRKILSILVVALLLAPGLVLAKVVTDSKKAFSVNAPDAWKYTSKSNREGQQSSGWANPKNTGALVLSSIPVDISLDEWAERAARQNPNTVVSAETLSGQPAKRLEFTTPEGYINTLWLTKKGKQGAMVSLVHTKECPDNIPAIKKAILSSFHWGK